MKFLLVAVIGLFLTFTGFIMPYDDPYLSDAERLVNKILDESAKVIETKYGIKACGEGAAMPGGNIKKFNLSFDTRTPYTKQHLRELLIASAHELLNAINTNEGIRPYLKKYPFTVDNVQIIIFNHEKNGREVVDPGISVADIDRDGLTYSGVDPDNHFRYKSEFRETYEEALKLVKGQP